MTVAVEGPTDASVASRLLTDQGYGVGPVYGLRGKHHLDPKISAYNLAAKRCVWFVMRDFDHDFNCASELIASLVSKPSKYLCLRFPVRAVESWLLADTRGISKFLRVPLARVPLDPDSLPAPKQALIDLARSSRLAAIRADIVPDPGREVGPGYTGRIVEFVSKYWEPRRSVERSKSLRRCVEALRKVPAPPGFR